MILSYIFLLTNISGLLLPFLSNVSFPPQNVITYIICDVEGMKLVVLEKNIYNYYASIVKF